MNSDVQKLLQKHPPQKLPLQRRKLLPPKKLRLLAGDLLRVLKGLSPFLEDPCCPALVSSRCNL